MRQGTKVIKDHGFLYLAMEVRTGKTLTSLSICSKLNAYNVLFVTKKKAISSIDPDTMSPRQAHDALYELLKLMEGEQ